MQQIWSATGRRKRATAQVRIASPGTGAIQINQVVRETINVWSRIFH